jgi:hypothetical protein
MTMKRLPALVAASLCLLVVPVVASAGTAASPQSVALVAHGVLVTWLSPSGQGTIGEAKSTVGSRVILSARLYNRTAQFGKAPGVAVGRLLLDCTVLNIPADGNCTGIVHLPNGFFLIGGNGPFKPTPRLYAIVGGIGPYASARGEVETRTTSSGASLIDVKLLPST